MPRGQKAGRAARLPTPLGYGNSLTTFCQRGSLGSEEVFLQVICSETEQRARAGKHNRKRLRCIYTQVLKRPRRPQTLWYNDVCPNLLHDPFGPGQNTGSPASTDGVGGATSSSNSPASVVPGELLIAFSLRAEARGLFLQTCRGPSDPHSHSEARQTQQTPRSTGTKPLEE